jgi:hypothetical protein
VPIEAPDGAADAEGELVGGTLAAAKQEVSVPDCTKNEADWGVIPDVLDGSAIVIEYQEPGDTLTEFHMNCCPVDILVPMTRGSPMGCNPPVELLVSASTVTVNPIA